MRFLAVLTLFLLVLLAAPNAFAACTNPAGNAGDLIYSSISNVMAYCNNTNWVGMGTPGMSVSFGTFTAGDFCTAPSGTQISCTTTAIDLASKVTGVLPAANGGTGTGTTFTQGSIVFAGASGVYS